MELVTGQGRPAPGVDSEQTWPLDARMALFLLESEGPPVQQSSQRASERCTCRIQAQVMRASETGIEHVEIFLRDLSDSHMGFVSNRPLEVGATYELNLHATGDKLATAARCVVLRSRSFMTDWHEGALQLVRRQQSAGAHPMLRIAV